ncbi:MAG: high-potential iron-sulfur protein [Bradyrhizobium sp.]
MNDRSLSRRQLFPTLFAGAAMAAALSLGLSESAEAQSKVSKTIAKYQDQPNGGNECSLCQFFQGPHSCQLVAGDISPNGWCSFFAKKA